jgi:histidinol dehydrogenase
MRVLAMAHRRDARAIEAIATTDRARDPRVVRAVARIVADVRRRGDAAVGEWMRRLDGVAPPFVVPAAARRAGWAATPRAVRAALRQAARHIAVVAEAQRPRPCRIDVRPGIRIDQRVQPLERVACYVPGGRHPLPSTVLMTVVPARVAGVRDITVVCPRPSPAVLAAALEAGATRVLRIGGAQAIAALAYGTASIARVDKIVGPGSAWVAAAKRLVAADCGVDVHAGPSEIAIYANGGDPDVWAADLVAQAEHDPDARAIFVTTVRALAEAVADAADRRAARYPTAAEALARGGAVILARHAREAIALVNRLAPEHLVVERASDAAACTTAGTIFVGPWSAQAAGDYATGSNHVLPTGGAARLRGGLTAADFVRVFTVQRLTRRGLAAIAPAVIALAEAEGLPAHADSVRVRGSYPFSTGSARSVPGVRRANAQPTPGTDTAEPVEKGYDPQTRAHVSPRSGRRRRPAPAPQ